MKFQLFVLCAAFVVAASSFKIQSRLALCSECVQYIEDLSTKALENSEECQERAQKMCDLLSLPELMNKKCQEHVMEEAGKIIQAIKDAKSARDICTDLRLCRAQ